MNNSEAMTKAIDTATVSTGLLGPEQARAFVQQVFEATPMLSAARRVPMGARKMNVDKLGVGARILRRRFEGVAVPGGAGVTASQIQLDAVGLSLPWEVTEDTLRYNIEGERFEESVIALMTRQVGVDLNDLAWNGNATPPAAAVLDGPLEAADTTISVVSTLGYPAAGVLAIGQERVRYTSLSSTAFSGVLRGYEGTVAADHPDGGEAVLAADWLLTALNGWLKQASAAAHSITASSVGGGAMDKAQFKAILNAMPTRYLATASADRLRWIMHPRTSFAFFDMLTERPVGAGDAVLLGATGRAPYGYPILEDPAVPVGTIVFTDPRNLLIGIALDIRISRDASSKDVLSRGVRYYQIDLAADVKIEEADAMVISTGITV